jgi:hypothetical protein
MEARLAIKRSPSTFVAILFALAVTSLLGGTLGYTLKPATVISGPTHVIVLPAAQPNSAIPGSGQCPNVNPTYC